MADRDEGNLFAVRATLRVDDPAALRGGIIPWDFPAGAVFYEPIYHGICTLEGVDRFVTDLYPGTTLLRVDWRACGVAGGGVRWFSVDGPQPATA